jgi:phage host-nuclease inhibitor protein Gam
MEKAELIITALQQRIGEITSNYETQIAMLRADLTILIQEKEDLAKSERDYQDQISEKCLQH